ncbi:MAG: sulfate/molybdate ABC transporter ATP-binding protein [Planctomycetia bacterium]
MSIHVREISKSFGSFKALDRVSLDVPEGTLLALLGPSGSGKTTLLRIIAGLEFPEEGVIEEDGEDITERHARQREVGFVFQHYALFRHMSVFENIAFGLRVRKVPQAEVTARVDELLKLVRLEGLGGRKPAQLSGGQRQRVALARALAIRPKILLLDEPFGALDAKVRVELRQWLRRLHDEIGMTSVFVTHDQEEAFELADTVVVMNHGKIEQQGTPDEVFDHPATPFVMDFLGNVNVYHGRVENGRAFWHGIPIDYPEYPHAQAREARVYLRPHELEISSPAAAANRLGTSLQASVLRVTRSGLITRVSCRPHGSDQELQVDIPTETARRLQVNLEPGAHVAITPRKARVFVPDPEYVI